MSSLPPTTVILMFSEPRSTPASTEPHSDSSPSAAALLRFTLFVLGYVVFVSLFWRRLCFVCRLCFVRGVRRAGGRAGGRAGVPVRLACGRAGWCYSRNLPIPTFPWSACRVHLMSSLLGWACQYYSPNLDIPAFPWSACRVHLMLSLPLALGHAITILAFNVAFNVVFAWVGMPVLFSQLSSLWKVRHRKNDFHKNFIYTWRGKNGEQKIITNCWGFFSSNLYLFCYTQK